MTEEFSAHVGAIPSEMQSEMTGRSFHSDPACPPFSALRLVRLAHFNFSDIVTTGELVVAASIAEETVAIFERIFAARFPIAHMTRIDAFDGSDETSMAANNSSAFNFRRVEGTRVLSHHARGLAIDINPVQNPWVRNDRIEPAAGAAYLDRTNVRPGMIVPDGPVVAAFAAAGWHWGGTWEDARDYHHFSKLPR